jgi:hypothetical protein
MTFVLPGGIGQLFAVPGFSAWNPASLYVTSPPGVLSNSNRTLTAGSTNAAVYNDIKGTKSQNTGKYYFEVTIVTQDNTGGQGVGLVNPSWVAGGLYAGSNANGVGCTSAGVGVNYVVYQGGTQQSSVPTVVPANGDVIGVAVDSSGTVVLAQTLVYFRVNTIWNNAGSGGTTLTPTSWDYAWPAITTLFPACNCVNLASGGGFTGVNTLNVGNTAFVRAPPSGFVAWG